MSLTLSYTELVDTIAEFINTNSLDACLDAFTTGLITARANTTSDTMRRRLMQHSYDIYAMIQEPEEEKQC